MKIDINYNINADFQDNKEKYTIAMWMAKNKTMIIP